MEEDDHDELLQCTDDESMSESEDQCLPMEKPEDPQKSHVFTTYSTFQFLLTKVTLIFSSTFLIVLFPLYLQANSVKGNSYTMISFTAFFSFMMLLFIFLFCKSFFPKYRFIAMWKPPLHWCEMLKIAVVYTLCGFMIVYAVHEKKVMCHLQDPIKGIVLVFSLIFYFFFCTKLMGLQRIFSTTTIIVGLFISVDYGLCDEFRCRGFEREHRADDAGPWNWQVHSLWAGVYIVGLALFSAYYTLLDRYAVPLELFPIQTTVTTSLLTTISRLVSFQNSNGSYSPETRPLTCSPRAKTQNSYLHLSFWVHLLSLVLVFGFFWIEMVPNIGKSANFGDFMNKTMSGYVCHFTVYSNSKMEYQHCGNVSIYAWLFVFTYIVYTMSSILFLIISQSAVYTVATTTTSLPLAGIWWSLFRMVPIENGLIIWSPSVSGELICALLGLPIVLIGLILLAKSHLKDCRMMRANLQPNPAPPNFA